MRSDGALARATRAALGPEYRWITGIVACALLIRLSVLTAWTPGTVVVSDMGNYDRIATDLANATVRVNHTFFPIGYPAFLAFIYTLVGRSFLIVGILQAVLGALTCLATWSLARRFGASERAARIGAIVVAAYPPFIYYGAFLLTEAIAPFFFAAVIWLLLRAVDGQGSKGVALAGLALASATLIRTNFLVLYPFIALVTWAACRPDSRRGMRVAAGVMASALPLLMLASAHNSRLLGRPAGLSTNGGMNFFMLQANYQRFESPDASWTPIRNGLRYAATYKSPVLSHNERFLYREGLSWFLARPDKVRHVLSNLAEGVGLGLQGYWPANRLMPGDPSEQTWLRRVLRLSSLSYFWTLVLPTLVAAAVALYRRELLGPGQTGALLGLSLLIGVAVTSVLFLADPRMHVPFDPVLIAIVCAAASSLPRTFARRYSSPLSETSNLV